MTWIFSALGAILAIGVLVVVHEFGHFLVAKLFKVGVPVFSVGMGPRILGFRYKGTDYRLSIFPIGGYVQMAGADPFGEEDFGQPPLPPEQDFMRKPVWQRLLIMLAGPGANVVLPISIFFVLFLVGYPERVSEVGLVSYDSPAWQAGLRAGDRIVAVADDEVRVWRDVHWAMAHRVGQPVALTVDRSGQRVPIELPAGAYDVLTGDIIDSETLGVEPGQRSTRIGVDDPRSPAALAGLQTFDGITAVDGGPVETWGELLGALGAGGRHEIDVVRVVDNNRQQQTLTLEASAAWQARDGDPWSNPWGLVPADVFAGSILADKPAEVAGVQVGDRLYAVDGVRVHDFLHLKSLVGRTAIDPDDRAAGTRTLTLTLVRDGELVDRAFKPRLIEKTNVFGTRYTPLMGVGLAPDTRVLPPRELRSYGPVEAATLATTRTWQAAMNVFTVLDAVVRGRTNPGSVVGGPVAIFTVTGRSLLAGIHAYADTIATISVSLAIVNLLPVPALDGGQIIVFLLEWVRGRPLSAQVRMRIQMLGVLMLFALIVLVTVSDVSKYLFPEV